MSELTKDMDKIKFSNNKLSFMTDKIATFVFYAVGIFLVLLLLLFAGYIIYNGRKSLNLNFLTTPPVFMQEGGGIGPQLFNSFYLMVISLIFSVPIGVGAGIYMAEYAKPNAMTRMIRLSL